MMFKEEIKKRIIFFDGAMGTALMKKGLPAGFNPEIINVTHGDIVRDIHREYLNAGSDVITANTFGANSVKLEGTGYATHEIITAAIKHARAAVDENEKRAFVAADIGPTGKLLVPSGELKFEEAYSIFSEVAISSEKAGADLAIIETMTDTLEMKAAVLAFKENTSLPIIASFSFDKNARLLTGGDISCAVTLLEGLGVDVIGLNCGFGPDESYDYFKEMFALSSTPVLVMPNAGLPKIVDGETIYDLDADTFSEKMLQIAKAGAHLIGGCCGTTPEHIRLTIDKCRDVSPLAISDKNLAVVSSYARSQVIGDYPVVVGERINPTGKKLFKQALRDDDFEYVLAQGLSQQQDGAHILDVNVGLPEIDEKTAMLKAIGKLQSVTPLPLQIDTADAGVMEAALRIYNGKPMINSVNGKESEMKKIFPLAKKYGGVIVALTLDENGIPESAQGRLEIAKRIVERAAEYGISKKDLIFDALTMAVSADEKAAMVTLESLKLIKETLGVNTILGVSNVSFGLPSREKINSVFFSNALFAGLDAGIINPSSIDMMQTLASFNALGGYDNKCENYLRVMMDEKKEDVYKPQTSTIYQAIVDGLDKSAYSLTVNELNTKNADEIISGHIIPALDKVGIDFEKSTIFLPQLLKSAAAAQKSFEAVREKMQSTGVKQAKKGIIILATVKGDIHDIGKNIVKVMLENYGYEIVDMGKDVECLSVALKAKELNVKLVGLSALMTTTLESMSETIRLLRIHSPGTKIAVGGAVLNEEYAAMIGADCYCKDASATVEYAKRIFLL